MWVQARLISTKCHFLHSANRRMEGSLKQMLGSGLVKELRASFLPSPSAAVSNVFLSSPLPSPSPSSALHGSSYVCWRSRRRCAVNVLIKLHLRPLADQPTGNSRREFSPAGDWLVPSNCFWPAARNDMQEKCKRKRMGGGERMKNRWNLLSK